MSAAIEQRNQDATIYVGNLDEKINEELLWELMLQCGPVVNVHMPRDKVTGKSLGYGFVEFRSEEDAEYATKVMNMVKLHHKPLKINKTTQDKKQIDVGANIFIGNLDPEVDEKLLYDTFGAFGGILTTPKIMRDPDTTLSKGYGFISYDSFESSDMAIECMNGQYFCNRPIVVQYAFKKDTPGERHGSQAERILAASIPKLRPHTIFSGGAMDSTIQLGNPLAAMNMMPPMSMMSNQLASQLSMHNSLQQATMQANMYQMQMAAVYNQQLQYSQSNNMMQMQQGYNMMAPPPPPMGYQLPQMQQVNPNPYGMMPPPPPQF